MKLCAISYYIIYYGFYIPLVNSALNIENYAFLDNTYCNSDLSSTIQLDSYDFSLTNFKFENSWVENGNLTWSVPKLNTLYAYFYEATRKNFSVCSYCPYNYFPEIWNPEIVLSGGIRLNHYPMYGPCLNGARSIKIKCVQNQIFFPGDYVGEYFFPDQFPISSALQSPIHNMILNSDNVDYLNRKIHPSLYGLGEQNVKSYLDGFTTNDLNFIPLISNVKRPYVDISSTQKRWLKWAQHDCSVACYKNAYYNYATVKQSDVAGHLTRIFLYRMTADNTVENVVRCLKCQSYQASYVWLSLIDENSIIGRPNDFVKSNWFSMSCYPWFGSIPKFTTQNPISLSVNFTQINSIGTTGIISPLSFTLYNSEVCYPNFYNDVCAHSIWYNRRLGLDNAGCKACPFGFHTDEKYGAWFCTPPYGKLMVYRGLLNLYKDEVTNHSLLWSRRDILSYEFECGYLPAHCKQCNFVSGAIGLTPVQFNQKFILDTILASEDCPSGKYCTHPFQSEPQDCPAEFPWSDPGSFNVLNCTCSKGYYLNNTLNRCVSCTLPNTCSSGQYLKDWKKCITLNGPKIYGTECVSCSNKPLNSEYIFGENAYGLEIGILSSLSGICPFRCNSGFKLTYVESSSDFCFASFSCVPITSLLNSNGVRLYFPGLISLYDELSIIPSVDFSTATCTPQRAFTLEVSKQETGNWPAISSTCSQANNSFCDNSQVIVVGGSARACTVVREATIFNNYVCNSCRQRPLPANAMYSNRALIGSTELSLRHHMCEIVCNSGELYYNGTSDQCMSCTLLEQTFCASGQKISGNGCLQNYSMWDIQNLSMSCTSCTKDPRNAPSGFFLDYRAGGGCEYVACSLVVDYNYQYVSIPCGQGNPGRVESKIFDCAPEQYLYGQYTTTTTKTCKNCTSFLPGSYKKANCSRNIEDAIWESCPTGYYCDGKGFMNICPFGKTSFAGRVYQSDCFCPVGTEFNFLKSICSRKICPNTLGISRVPGEIYRSPYYMTLNIDTLESVCVPCNVNHLNLSLSTSSYSVGNGVGISSCVCPPNMYSLDSSSSGGISCLRCDSVTYPACSGSNYWKVADSCWSGYSKSSNFFCSCILPPFSTGSNVVNNCGNAGSGSSITCNLGFNFNDLGFNPLTPSDIASGSSLYLERSSYSNDGWSPFVSRPLSSDIFNIQNYNIKLLETTSDSLDFRGGGEFNTHYVFWTIEDENYGHYIWTSPIPPLAFSTNYNSYNFDSRPWEVLCPYDLNIMKKKVIGFSVASWKSPIVPSVFYPNFPFTSVHALVSFEEASNSSSVLFQIYSIQLTLDSTKNVDWRYANFPYCGASIITDLALSPFSSVVSIMSSHAYPGYVRVQQELNLVGGLFVAFNDISSGISGIKSVPFSHDGSILRVQNTSNNFTSDYIGLSTLGYIEAITSSYLPLGVKGIRFYVIFKPNFRQGNDVVKMVHWMQKNVYFHSSEIFKLNQVANSISYSSIHLMWHSNWFPLSNFLFVDANNNMWTADSVQRTITPIQGFVNFSSVSNGGLRAISRGSTQGSLVGTYGSNIYHIKVNRCLLQDSKPTYWDGLKCVPHVCIRSMQCSQDGSQIWNFTQMKCICAQGYYQESTDIENLLCKICPQNFFCQSQNKQPCPYTQITRTEGSFSSQQCICGDGQYFDGNAQICQTCSQNKWCPNNWDSFECPGTSLQQSQRQFGTVYPTSCVCSPGFVGPFCSLCPNNRICPQSLSLSLVTNYAFRIYISNINYNKLSSLAAGLSIESFLCDSVLSTSLKLLSSSGIWYLMSENTLRKRFFCKFIQYTEPLKGMPMILSMIQVDKGDSGSSSLWGQLVNSQSYALSGIYNVANIQQIIPSTLPTFFDIINNTEQVCTGLGKTPNENRVGCVCDKGYETIGVRCSSCPQNTYKSMVGVGNCLPCNIGKTSGLGASVCYIENDLNITSNQNNGSNNMNMAVLIGGAAGGVVLVFLVIYGYIRLVS